MPNPSKLLDLPDGWYKLPEGSIPETDPTRKWWCFVKDGRIYSLEGLWRNPIEKYKSPYPALNGEVYYQASIIKSWVARVEHEIDLYRLLESTYAEDEWFSLMKLKL